jgi:hypothetical protein
MKKVLLAGAATALLAAPAFADGDLIASTDLYKNIYIYENFDIDNDVEVDVDVNIIVEKAANSTAVANQRNEYNRACSNCAEKRDTIDYSGNYNLGGVSVNQAAGNMNNQGTLVSIAVDDNTPAPPPPDSPPPPPPPPGDEGGYGFAEAQGTGEQINNGNSIDTVNVLYRDANIFGSFSYNTGIVHANQATGNMNNQLNILSVAISLAGEGGVALAEADLGQFNTNQTVVESDSGQCDCGINKAARIEGSFNGNTGIFGANQAVGNMGNQANVVSIAAVGEF